MTRLKTNAKQFRPIFVKIISKVLNEQPEINRVLIRNKFRQRLDNRIFIPTVLRNKGSYDLSGISIDNAYKLTNNELQKNWDKKISDLRAGKNKPIQRAITLYRWMPRLLIKAITKIVAFFHYTLNIPISIFGLPDDPFGAVTITFLDRFNIKYAHVPIYAFSRSYR